MTRETISYGGWKHCLRIANGDAELVVTLDVGPRILVYRRRDGRNVLKTFPGELGHSGEKEWMIRGGHRFWTAPEDVTLTYYPDNESVSLESGSNGASILGNRIPSPHPLRKDLSVRLAPEGTRVDLFHTITNEGSSPITLAPWALTVMAPGGTAIIPLPPLKPHLPLCQLGNPSDLLPNKNMVFWPYTDLSDPRIRPGRRFLRLHQGAGSHPIKIGLAVEEKWAAYLTEEDLFVKTFPYAKGAHYPDHGCNFESFTDNEMLELESLGPLTTLLPGEKTSHPETWHLLTSPPGLSPLNEESFAETMNSFLSVIP